MRIPGNIGRSPVEQVRNIDLVLVVTVAVGEDVCALDGLGEVTEDVVDNDDCVFGIIVTRDVCEC